MLSWVAITPARNEAANLPRLAESLADQSVPSSGWVVVDNGSSDGTPEAVNSFARENPWARLLEIPPAPTTGTRGAPSVRAFHAGLATIRQRPDLVLNLDADISLPPDYVQRLCHAFDRDPRLGIAGGTCYELSGGRWRQRHVTGDTVWGASRAFRWECLQDILPLEERMSWDSLSQLKANALGWTTLTLIDLPFHHHRPEGERDGSRVRARRNQGRAAHYMWYRPWYLGLRSLVHLARGDIGAPALLVGYADAALGRVPRSPDPLIREYVRRNQSIGRLPRRFREAMRRSGSQPPEARPETRAGR